MLATDTELDVTARRPPALNGDGNQLTNPILIKARKWIMRKYASPLVGIEKTR